MARDKVGFAEKMVWWWKSKREKEERKKEKPISEPMSMKER